MKKLAAGALLALLLVALCLPAGAVMNKYSTMYLDSFDTVITLIGYAESEEMFNEQADQVHEMFLYMHKLFDTYNSYETRASSASSRSTSARPRSRLRSIPSCSRC